MFLLLLYWFINPNSLDNKGSCWILLDFYCSLTMLREIGLKKILQYSGQEAEKYSLQYFFKLIHNIKILLRKII